MNKLEVDNLFEWSSVRDICAEHDWMLRYDWLHWNASVFKLDAMRDVFEF